MPSDPPLPGPGAEVVETHISRVLLDGDLVWKLKKPVNLGFVDYSTRRIRRAMCEAEVALNRRWAPGVYLGVVEVDGEPAVLMRRLDDRWTLRARIDTLTVDDARRVGAHLGALHRDAPLDPDARRHATAEAVARNALENFDHTRDHVGWSVSAAVHRALERHTRAALDGLAPTFDARAEGARTLHGDLRAEHVYLQPDGRIVVLDAVEFDAKYRDGDPAGDIAFLAMDLAVRGRRDLARALLAAWIEATADTGATEVLPFYVAYRSAVRAKIRGLQRDRFRARRHWLFALGTLAPEPERPILVGVGGLPGTGKSTVAAALARRAGFTAIRSDVVRKELAGLDPLAPAGEDGYETGLYTPENKDRVYRECLGRAERVLFDGGRVAVDASFSREKWRLDLLDLARDLGVVARLWWCEAPPDVVRARLDARTDDPSDATWEVYRVARGRWEAEGPRTRAALDRVDTTGGLDATERRAIRALRRALRDAEIP